METIEYFDGEFYFNNYDGTKWEKVIPIQDKIAATEVSARSLYGDFTVDNVAKSTMTSESGDQCRRLFAENPHRIEAGIHR